VSICAEATSWLPTSHVPGAVVDRLQNRLLSGIYPDKPVEAWAILQALVAAEFGSVRIDYDGQPNVWSANRRNAPDSLNVQRTLTARQHLADLGYDDSRDMIRNLIRVPWVQYTTSGLVPIWSLTELVAINPTETQVYNLKFEKPLAGAITTLLGYAYTAPNGTGTGYAYNDISPNGIRAVVTVTSPTTATLTITNIVGATLWIVDNTGVPYLIVNGTPIVKVDTEPAEVKDAVAIARRGGPGIGEAPLEVDDNVWRQSAPYALGNAWQLLATLRDEQIVLHRRRRSPATRGSKTSTGSASRTRTTRVLDTPVLIEAIRDRFEPGAFRHDARRPAGTRPVGARRVRDTARVDDPRRDRCRPRRQRPERHSRRHGRAHRRGLDCPRYRRRDRLHAIRCRHALPHRLGCCGPERRRIKPRRMGRHGHHPACRGVSDAPCGCEVGRELCVRRDRGRRRDPGGDHRGNLVVEKRVQLSMGTFQLAAQIKLDGASTTWTPSMTSSCGAAARRTRSSSPRPGWPAGVVSLGRSSKVARVRHAGRGRRGHARHLASVATNTAGAGYRSFWLSTWKNLRGPSGRSTGRTPAMRCTSTRRSGRRSRTSKAVGIGNGVRLYSSSKSRLTQATARSQRCFMDLFGNSRFGYKIESTVTDGNVNQVEMIMVEAIASGTGCTGIYLGGTGPVTHIKFHGVNLEQFDTLVNFNNGFGSTVDMNYVELRNTTGLNAFTFGANSSGNLIDRVGFWYVPVAENMFSKAGGTATFPNKVQDVNIFGDGGVVSNGFGATTGAPANTPGTDTLLRKCVNNSGGTATGQAVTFAPGVTNF
jgi:hypothetical protein